MWERYMKYLMGNEMMTPPIWASKSCINFHPKFYNYSIEYNIMTWLIAD